LGNRHSVYLRLSPETAGYTIGDVLSFRVGADDKGAYAEDVSRADEEATAQQRHNPSPGADAPGPRACQPWHGHLSTEHQRSGPQSTECVVALLDGPSAHHAAHGDRPMSGLPAVLAAIAAGGAASAVIVADRRHGPGNGARPGVGSDPSG